MKVPLLLAVTAIAVEAAVLQPASLLNIYHEIYPSDPGKRQALKLCILEDTSFNRLSANARETCYRHARGELPVADSMAWTALPPNQVALQRAAYFGSTPRNDIRITLLTQR